MSKFYSVRKAELTQLSSPPLKRSISPSSAIKRKPFVSTTKSAESFGPPPPLPIQSPDRSTVFVDQSVSLTDIAEPDFIASSHFHLLQRQTVRWLNLSLTLWSLIVLDSQRTVEIGGLAQFVEVMSWRAHGVVSEDEFSVLFSEWMTTSDRPSVASGAGMHTVHGSRRQAVGVFLLRQLLLEKRLSEADLDLFTGMVVHETNVRLLNSALAFTSKPFGGRGACSLEVCSSRWLALCEELFFSLDTSGYGLLRFDEAFFFSACLVLGLHGWEDERELDSDLSVASMSALALQFMRDAGAQVVTSHGRAKDEQRGSPSRDRGLLGQRLVPRKERSGGGGLGKHELTLSMFKRHLVRRGVGEAALSSLIAHVRSCVETTVRLSRGSGVEELCAACTSLESGPSGSGIVGSPKLWQQAVLSASRFEGAEFPPVLLYLLTDAESLVSGRFRASDDCGSDQQAAVSSPSRAPQQVLGGDLLHETAHRLWSHFKVWGTDTTAQHGGGTSVRQPSASTHDLQRDLTYQLILAVLAQYKASQQLLCAALFDVAVSTVGFEGLSGLHDGASDLAMACANLLSNARAMMRELGVVSGDEGVPDCSDDEEGEAALDLGASGGRPALSLSELETVSPPVAQTQHPRTARDFQRNGTNSQRDGEAPSAAPAGSRVPPASSIEASDGTAALGNANSEAPLPPKSSSLPGAERRRSLLVALENRGLEDATSQSAATPTQTPVAIAAVPPDSVRALRTPATQPEAYAAAVPRGTAEKTAARRRGTVIVQTKPAPAPKAAAAASSSAAGRLFASSSAVDDVSSEVDGGGCPIRDHLSTESAVLGRLLASSDPSEQAALIDRLRVLRQGSGGSVTSNAATATQAPVSSTAGPHTPVATAPENPVSAGPAPTASVSGAGFGGGEVSVELAIDSARSITSEASGPHSIADLMEQGQNAGKYAQMLREILRTMSRDDSRVQLRSLEQVLQLGQSIADMESGASASPHREAPARPNQVASSARLSADKPAMHDVQQRTLRQPAPAAQPQVAFGKSLRDVPPRSSLSSSVSEDNRRLTADALSHHQQQQQELQHRQAASSAAAVVVAPQSGVIRRTAGVPGHMPSGGAKKSAKVFGHPA